MGAETPTAWWNDPDVLGERAGLMLASEREEPEPSAMEEALRSAYRRVAADLDTITRLQGKNAPIDVPALLVEQVDEKLAAFLMLAKYTLIDLASASRAVLDIDLAHRQLALFAEILFRMEALDGLVLLYDFALAQARSGNARFWQNVSGHCLMLLALMEKQRPRVVAFLASRPVARKQLNGLISFTRPQVIGALLRESAKPAAPVVPTEPPLYLKLFDRYDPGLPADHAAGACATLMAQHRIAQALAQEDLPTVIRWFVEGSPAAAREVLRRTRSSLPRRAYRHFLEAILTKENPHPVRASAVVLELGMLNREDKPDGGVGEINRLLFETAMRERKERAGVSCVAVRELAAVRNMDALMVIIESAPLLRVAEEAIVAMHGRRRLLMAQPLLEARPKLQPVYDACHAELVEIQKIMEAVWNTDEDAEVQTYVARLKELRAFPELDTIAELAERKGDLYRLRLSREEDAAAA